MSYILSALRKAERERNPAPPASVGEFVGQTSAGPAAGKRSRGRWLLLVIVLVLLTCIGYLLGQRSQFHNSEPAVAAMPPDPAIAVSQGGGNQAPVVRDNASQAPASIAVPDAYRDTAPVPAPVREQPLPELAITGYIYFEDDPGRSKLFVDGIVHRLGSRLGDGLVITGFSPDHVIVSHHGRERRLAVE